MYRHILSPPSEQRCAVLSGVKYGIIKELSGRSVQLMNKISDRIILCISAALHYSLTLTGSRSRAAPGGGK